MNDNTLLVILCAAFLIVGGFLGGVIFSKTTVTEVEVPYIVTEYIESNCSCPNDNFVLTESEFEEDVEEAKAIELALESIESRDFEKAVFSALVDFNESIESYKDITEIKFEYDVDGDEVEFSKVKIYYFIDGDEDESEKALLEDFTVTIDDLDFDELDDASVSEDYLDSITINKVY